MRIGGRNGIGLYDVVENRLVGMKSRGVYETPGGTILYKAHEVLETLTLDKLTAHKKRELAITFGELVYDGQWFSPLRKALSAFVTSYNKIVVFIDRSPAGCYNNYRVLWIGLYHLPSNGFAEAPTTASLLKC